MREVVGHSPTRSWRTNIRGYIRKYALVATGEPSVVSFCRPSERERWVTKKNRITSSLGHTVFCRSWFQFVERRSIFIGFPPYCHDGEAPLAPPPVFCLCRVLTVFLARHMIEAGAKGRGGLSRRVSLLWTPEDELFLKVLC